ncbi:alpha/beta-hydrolase [Schizopora paradoxa]|uniref:Alpha/beta-hydrolase n=1 Tax=Schizopora paradoxa TaxID=27342 RepID=A0A0H2RT64_9AGAM|nr:alpha/beta-hydrolase [Schizopora paradoxa]
MIEVNVPTRLVLPFGKADADAMKDLLKRSPLPSKPPIPTRNPWELGIDHAFLVQLSTALQTTWSYEALEEKMADGYLVKMKDGEDELTVHFVHRKSARSGAIPLLLLHGWPGTFLDFNKVVEPLTNPPGESDIAFDVVIPSLPGFFLSTLPQREGWTIVDTARVFHRLMTDVLGYSKYAGQGGDWGSYILRIIGSLYHDAAPALHFNFFRCPKTAARDESALSEVEKAMGVRRAEFGRTGHGYLDIQSTKPFTIGISIGASPLAILAYIGEKIHAWSDPSCVDAGDILDTVALYYLSGCFPTSVLIYHQSNSVRTELSSDPSKWRVKSKIGFSAFPYEIGGAPRVDIEAVGPVVFYKEHKKGGHFPALDCPSELVADLREFFAAHW